MNVPAGLLAGRSVLIVEDQYLVADAMRRAVAELQGKVLGPAPSIAAALAILEVETADLALLDVNLGGEKIFPAIAELQRRHIPFIFTTGYERQVLGVEHELAPLLEKPVTTHALAEAVRKLL